MIRAYPNYKNSDVEWVGNIPSSWAVIPLFTVASESKISNMGMNEDNLLSLSHGKIIRKDIKALGGLLPESFETYQIINKNDVIFRLTDLQNDKRSLRSAICEERGIITSAYVAITPKKIRPKFMHYLMRAYDETRVFYNLGSGMRQSLRYDELKRLALICPPESDQEKIEGFLDHETARIDSLITEKQTFIKLLKEKRQTLISHVVTKGLNPNVKMKASGIAWIGEVPEHWAITKFGNLAFMQEGPGLRTWQFVANGVKVICGTNITEKGVNFEKLSKCISMDEYLEKYQHFTVKNGDLLLSSSGNSCGKVARYTGEEKVILNTSTIRINENLNRKLQLNYIEYYLKSDLFREQLDLKMTGACQLNFGPSHLKEILTVVPGTDEQQSIASYLAIEVGRLSKIINHAEYSVALLNARRSSLISAAVTGKIDVRSEVPITSDQPPTQESAHT